MKSFELRKIMKIEKKPLRVQSWKQCFIFIET